MRLTSVLLAGAVLGAAGCARVPQESVQLSITVGRDLAEAHRANRELAKRYFARMHDDVELFVSSTYRPYIIRQTMADLDLVGKIQRATAPNSTLDPIDVMEIYVEEILAKVSAFRSEMLQPIDQQEREVVEAIDVTFQRVQNANAVVTAHLASVRRVQEVQDEFLKDVGAGNLSERLAGRLAAFSDKLTKALDGGRRVETLLDQGPAALSKVKAVLDSLPARLGGPVTR